MTEFLSNMESGSTPNDVSFMLLGNKSDLVEKDRTINDEDVQEWIEKVKK
jgi:hypothetical protein